MTKLNKADNSKSTTLRATRTKSPAKKSAGKTRAPSIQERVYEELKLGLMVGAFLPGQTVSLRKLAEKLNTSLMPVREAINRLIAERAFEVLPNRSVIVPDMSREKLDELVHWRSMLEGEAAVKACANATPELIDRLHALNIEMMDGVQERKVRRVLSCNKEFHFTLYHASRSTVLVPMIESLWLQMGPFTFFSFLSPDLIWNSTFHIQIIEALQERDSDKIRDAIVHDVQTLAEYLVDSHMFDNVGPRPIA